MILNVDFHVYENKWLHNDKKVECQMYFCVILTLIITSEQQQQQQQQPACQC